MANKKRNIGIAINPPEATCENDNHCPFHGEISLRGRMLKGKVIRARVAKNALVEWNWLKKIPKYERFEKKRTRVMAHSPSCIGAKEGDIVNIMETRKISKTKSFVIVEKLKGEQI
jgi:small subunit ribosomal protein S17